MMFLRMSAIVLAISFAIESYGAVNVTASRDYVDRKIVALSNALENAFSKITPGGYDTVSNKAMSAIQTLEPATNYTDDAVSGLRGSLTSGGLIVFQSFEAFHATAADKADRLASETGEERSGKMVFSQIDSSTQTNADQSAKIDDLTLKKQDKLPYPTNAIPYSSISNASAITRMTLAGSPPFDFSNMRGVYLSLSNIIHALGGSVTNFPAFEQ